MLVPKYRLFKSDLYKSGLKFGLTYQEGDDPYTLIKQYTINLPYAVSISPFEHKVEEFIMVYRVTVHGDFPYHFYLAVMEIADV